MDAVHASGVEAAVRMPPRGGGGGGGARTMISNGLTCHDTGGHGTGPGVTLPPFVVVIPGRFAGNITA